MENTQRNGNNLLGQPHYELVSRYGYRETLMARRATKAEAQALKVEYQKYPDMYCGALIIRRVEL